MTTKLTTCHTSDDGREIRRHGWRSGIVVTVGAAALLALAGCSGSSSESTASTPAPTPAPTPSPTPDPGPSVEKGLFLDETLAIGSDNRLFDYYAPDAIPSTDAPVVIVLHGGTRNKDEIRDPDSPLSVWLDVADENGFLLIMPNGASDDGDVSAQFAKWNDCRADDQAASPLDDVAFIDTLIDWAANEYNADTTRVYVTGASNGGLMGFRAALELGNRIAAVSALISNVPANSDCAPLNQPVPMMLLVGTDDPLMPYGGGEVGDVAGDIDRGNVRSAAETLDFWVGYNGASAPQPAVAYDDRNSADNSTVTSTRYVGVADVVYYEVRNGGHAVPSIDAQLDDAAEMLVGNQNNDIEAVRQAWEFMSQY